MKMKVELEGEDRGAKVEGGAARRVLRSTGFGALGLGFWASGAVLGQVPDSPAPAAPAPPAASASSPASGAPASNASKAPGVTPNSSFLGKDVPAFDPGSDLLTWDGKSWN